MNSNNEVVKLLTELIQFKSVTPDMTECQKYIDIIFLNLILKQNIKNMILFKT
jgi:acetylornithine deacetylase/succinyl-diaminopimelate desuccinylase-like protein